MKYGVSACLTSLAVIAILVSACGGGGGGGSTPVPAPAPQTPQAVVFIALSTAAGQKNLSALSFQLQNDQLATTFANFSTGSAVPINGAIESIILSNDNRINGVNNIGLVAAPPVAISNRQPFIKVTYARGSGLKPSFNIYSSSLGLLPRTAVFGVSTSVTLKPSDFRITVQYL